MCTGNQSIGWPPTVHTHGCQSTARHPTHLLCIVQISIAGACPSAGQSASSTNGFRSSHTAAERQDPTSSSHAHDGLPAGINEDDGWVLSVGFDAELQRSELVLLDAAEIEAGPIAVLPLASPVGFGIHGTWVPTYFGP